MPYLRPDGKTQVTVQYIDGIPSRIENILISSQYEDGTDIYKMRNDIIENVIYSVIPKSILMKIQKSILILLENLLLEDL